MSDQKKPPPTPTPRVEVIRRPATAPGAPAPRPVSPSPTPSPSAGAPRTTVPAPAPRVPGPGAPQVSSRPPLPTATGPSAVPGAPRPTAPAVSTGPSAPRPAGMGPTSGPRPGGFGAPRGPGGPGARGGPPGAPGARRFPPHRPPARPPTIDEINALAKKERVPARIAKGDLEGKMKCRIWRKLHAEEAKRFDQSYTLMEQHPELDLADAFGVVQSGKSVAEFLAKKQRGKVKAEIKEARNALSGETIDGWLKARIESKQEVAATLGDRTVVDRLTENQPVAFVFERAGRVEKLQVVVIASKEHWDKLSTTLERDARLARKPVAVQRQPDRRPVADPRAFLPHLGKSVRLELRNGITLEQPLIAAGPYDLLVGTTGQELFVPLHAMLRWSVPGEVPPTPAPPPATEGGAPPASPAA